MFPTQTLRLLVAAPFANCFIRSAHIPIHYKYLPRFLIESANIHKRFMTSNEVEKALRAEVPRNDETTIFDKIIRKDIPADIIYEDDLSIAFNDINPQAPVHFLVIPKKKQGLHMLSDASEETKPMLGHLLYVAQHVAKRQGLDKGYRVVINNGVQGCQSVYHLHLHVIGGRQLGWPPC